MGTEQEMAAMGTTGSSPAEKKQFKCFAWWNNPTDRFAFFLVVVTFLLFGATVALVCSTNDLVKDAKETGEKGLRAWVVPTGASFFETPTTDYFRIRIDLQNTGKEPAINVRQTDRDSITYEFRLNQFGRPYIDSVNVPWPTEKTCNIPEPEQEPVGPIYPNEQTYYIRQGFGAEHFQELMGGSRIIIVQGCFLYEDTFHGKRQSPYCFYSVPTPPKPFRDWTFAPCLKRTEEPK